MQPVYVVVCLTARSLSSIPVFIEIIWRYSGLVKPCWKISRTGPLNYATKVEEEAERSAARRLCSIFWRECSTQVLAAPPAISSSFLSSAVRVPFVVSARPSPLVSRRSYSRIPEVGMEQRQNPTSAWQTTWQLTTKPPTVWIIYNYSFHRPIRLTVFVSDRSPPRIIYSR